MGSTSQQKAQDEGSDEGGDRLYVKSVEKAFRILEAFSAERPSMSLSEIGQATGMPKSAAQRFAHTLVQLGYLRRDPRTRNLLLTERNLQLGFQFRQTSPLVRLAMPYLIDLWRSTQESVNLCVLDGSDVIFVVRLMNTRSLAARFGSGLRAPAFCIAGGLAMLSRLEKAEARAILEQSDLRARTERTETRIPEIMTRLERVAAEGHVMCVGEYLKGDISIAAPVIEGLRPIAAISLSTTTDRMTPEDAEARFANMVASIANFLSAEGLTGDEPGAAPTSRTR